MTFLNLGVMLAILGLGMVASMVYYGSRGKKKMGEGFARLAEAVGGTSVQQSRMHYPRLTATVDGREVTVQVHLSAAQRRASDIVYLVLSTPVALPAATLVVREGYFAAAPGQGAFNDVAGDYLEGIFPGRYVYAEDEPATRALLAGDGVAGAIEALSAYPSLVLGPDALTVGKPYGGAKDLLTERVVPELTALAALAGALERAARNVPAPAASGA
jgi:hypothetical protein